MNKQRNHKLWYLECFTNQLQHIRMYSLIPLFIHLIKWYYQTWWLQNDLKKNVCIISNSYINLRMTMIINSWQPTSWIRYYIKHVSCKPNIASKEPMRKLIMRMHLSTKLYQLTIWIEVKQNTTKKQLELVVKVVIISLPNLVLIMNYQTYLINIFFSIAFIKICFSFLIILMFL